LSQHASSQDWLIIELKRAEANQAAVSQVSDYLLALGKKDEFNSGRLEGCLIAERIPHAVAENCKAEGIRAYEISWPMTLLRKV
jgi:RecB family endonuclease NucS